MILPVYKNFDELLPTKVQYYSNAQEMGAFRRMSFLGRFFDKNYGRYSGERGEFISFMSSFIDSANEMYGENWDIYPEYTGDIEEGYAFVKLHAIIYYEKFTIKNSTGRKHQIRDFCVSIPLAFTSNMDDEFVFRISDVNGFRLKWYGYENDSNYVHSHLSTNLMDIKEDSHYKTMLNCALYHEQSFCTNGNELSTHMTEMKIEDNITIDEMTLFFHTLNSFLEWESLEGVPYRKIRDLSEIGRTTRNVTNEDRELEGYANHFISEIKANPEHYLELVYSQNKLQVLDDNNFKEKLRTYYIENLLTHYDTHPAFVIKIGQDLFAYPEGKVKMDNTKDLYWKDDSGKDVSLKINNKEHKIAILTNPAQYKTEPIEIDNYFIHPKLIKNVCKRIESQLFKKIIERKFIESKFESRNA